LDESKRTGRGSSVIEKERAKSFNFMTISSQRTTLVAVGDSGLKVFMWSAMSLALPLCDRAPADALSCGARNRSFCYRSRALSRHVRAAPLFFSIPAVVFAGIWFFTQVVQGTGGIAWWAHIGGFYCCVGLSTREALP